MVQKVYFPCVLGLKNGAHLSQKCKKMVDMLQNCDIIASSSQNCNNFVINITKTISYAKIQAQHGG